MSLFSPSFEDWGPVLMFPEPPVVIDLSGDEPPTNHLRYTWGKYGEHRPRIYTMPLFQQPEAEPRTIHVGVDLGAPAGTPVFAPAAGRIIFAETQNDDGGYGGTLVGEFSSEGKSYWLLFGHISRASVERWSSVRDAGADVGVRVCRGQLIAWLGVVDENGGWPPHLHLQVSRERPERCDLPGAVSAGEFAAAQKLYPDPSEWLRRNL